MERNRPEKRDGKTHGCWFSFLPLCEAAELLLQGIRMPATPLPLFLQALKIDQRGQERPGEKENDRDTLKRTGKSRGRIQILHSLSCIIGFNFSQITQNPVFLQTCFLRNQN